MISIKEKVMKQEINAYRIVTTHMVTHGVIIVASSYGEAEQIFYNEYGHDEEGQTILRIDALALDEKLLISRNVLSDESNLSQLVR